MGLSSVGETKVLDALLADVYVSLHTADPGNTGASEIVGGNYARQIASFSSSGSNPTVRSNNVILQFPIATADWGTITHVGMWDEPTGGAFLGSASLAAPKDVLIDDAPRYPVGAFQVMVN